MNNIIFPVALQSSVVLTRLHALIKDICDKEDVFVCREKLMSPLLFVIHGGWLQSRLCQDGMIYRAISAKKLAHHFDSIWQPLHQACVDHDAKSYLASRARLLQMALTDTGGKKAAFWGGLARIECAAQLFFREHEETEENSLQSELAYQFGVQIFWRCHTVYAGVTFQKNTPLSSLLLSGAEDRLAVDAWEASLLRANNDFYQLPGAFRRHFLREAMHDFLTVMKQEVSHA